MVCCNSCGNEYLQKYWKNIEISLRKKKNGIRYFAFNSFNEIINY